MFFGSQKPKEKTVLIVDVETGSVGGALARLSSEHPAKLFGERRVHVPVGASRESGALAQGIAKAAGEVIAHVSEVAARLRMYPKTRDMGTINRVALFFSPPWGVPNLQEGKPSFVDSIARVLKGLVGAHVGSVPTSLHTHAGALVRSMNTLLGKKGLPLFISAHGEVLELVLVKDGSVVGHGTVQLGLHSLVRTLRTHGGISEHEVRSVLSLREFPQHFKEPVNAFSRHFREQFREIGEPLFTSGVPEKVFVFSRGPEAHYFAHTLSDHSLADLFPHGGTVQVLSQSHFAPHITAHSPRPDIVHMLCALFVDSL